MVAPRHAARDLQIDNAVAHSVAADGLAHHTASAAGDIGMRIRSSASERRRRSR